MEGVGLLALLKVIDDAGDEVAAPSKLRGPCDL
jgi:hypothetical protein